MTQVVSWSCSVAAHMAWELTDSFLTKEEAEKDCCLVALVSEYILEVSPRMPMLSHGETSGVLKQGYEEVAVLLILT